MESKLNTHANNELLISNNFMDVESALDAGLSELEISIIIKLAKKEKLTERESDIVFEAYKKLMKIEEKMKSLGLDPSVDSSSHVEDSERTSPFESIDIDNDNMFGGKRKRKRRKRKTKRRKRKTKKRKGGRYLACVCKKKRRSTGGKKRRRKKTRRRKK